MPSLQTLLESDGEPAPASMPTGFSQLDEVTGGFRPGQVWLVVSTPGEGRSTLLLHWAVAFAQRSLRTKLIVPRQPDHDLRNRVASRLTGSSVRQVSGEVLAKATDVAVGCPLTTSKTSLGGDGPGAGAVVVDDADLVTDPVALGDRALAGFVVVASLPRDEVVSPTGLRPRWTRIADVVLEIETRTWAWEVEEPATFRLLKHRWGPLVQQRVHFEPGFARFRDAPEEA